MGPHLFLFLPHSSSGIPVWVTSSPNPCPLGLTCPLLFHSKDGLGFLFCFVFNWRIITVQYCNGFCRTSTWISHRYTCDSPSWTPPTSLPTYPSGLSRSTSFGCPASCTELALLIYFIYGNVHVLEKEMLTHSRILACKTPWTEEPDVLHMVHGVAKSRTWLREWTTMYMFQCYSLKSSHPRLLPLSPKVCSLLDWDSVKSWITCEHGPDAGLGSKPGVCTSSPNA